MAKRYSPAVPATRRVVQYLDPSMTGVGLVPMTERELLAKRAEDRRLYARWVQRRAELAERDRKVRRFLLSVGLLAGLAGLAVVAGAVWFVAQAVVSLGVGLLAIPVALLALAGLAVGGHRCVTVVQHWH
jgi:hypothetical protein